MRRFLKDLITVANGEDGDIGRVLWALGVLFFLGLETYRAIAHHGEFDAQAFGVGFGALLAAGGGALWLKDKTEPK